MEVLAAEKERNPLSLKSSRSGGLVQCSEDAFGHRIFIRVAAFSHTRGQMASQSLSSGSMRICRRSVMTGNLSQNFHYFEKSLVRQFNEKYLNTETIMKSKYYGRRVRNN
ncbi:hypothetical protein [Dyadobacter sp. SG02]|uniref:hypothetical protein n=1 Tax=Dyadobacter sp. SG02 TaxID=1855291 RepID=UPI00115FD102|nr:hypothetical protein [Dyadobacter sp. SG02]